MICRNGSWGVKGEEREMRMERRRGRKEKGEKEKEKEKEEEKESGKVERVGVLLVGGGYWAVWED